MQQAVTRPVWYHDASTTTTELDEACLIALSGAKDTGWPCKSIQQQKHMQ
jgi:hypothetical protein